MNKTIILITFLFVTFSISKAQNNDQVIEQIIEIGSNDNQTMQHLDVLSNRFGGRLIGSDAYENAAQWAAYKFESWGMEVQMDYAGELPVGFNRGPWFGRMLGEKGMHLHFVTPSYTSGTKGVQRGHVLIEPYTQAEFDRIKGKLNGAWVLIGGKSKGWPIDYTSKSKHRRDSIIKLNAEIEIKNNVIRRENWYSKKDPKPLLPLIEEPGLFYDQMRDAGILGIIQSAPVPLAAMYDRKNIDSMTFETLPVIPDIKLDEHQYAEIKQMTKERRYFQLEFDIRNHFKMGPIKYHNVIAKIPGTKYPDEYVIMGGHLDAFDVATGGVDDGSGVTPAMEAARLIMKAGGKPKRSILVCLWAGEEFGLLGSKSWVENNEDKLEHISNMFNRDGGPTVPTSINVPPSWMKDIQKICKPINAIDSDFPLIVKERKPRTKPSKARGTDAGSFSVKGVPTVTFGTGDPKGYNFSYREIWHTERDTYNMSIPEYQNHTSIVTAIVVYGIANLNNLLPRHDYFKPEVEKATD